MAAYYRAVEGLSGANVGGSVRISGPVEHSLSLSVACMLVQAIRQARQADANRLQAEYNRLVQGLVAQVGSRSMHAGLSMTQLFACGGSGAPVCSASA